MTLPFFVLHGEADIVTDPEVSRALYERASSSDKTIKLYPGMWHGLTAGEPDDNIEIVFSDIIAWLDKRAGDDGARIEDSNPPRTPMLLMSECLSITASSPPPMRERSGRPRAHVKYLCGWKGRGLHHHSSM